MPSRTVHRQRVKALSSSNDAPSATDRRPGHGTLVSEVLAAAGGVVVLVGAGLITARYWPELSVRARLAVVAAAATVLLISGAAVPVHLPSGKRLRTALWLTSIGAAGLFLGLLGADVLDWQAIDVTLLIGLGTSAYAAALWLCSRQATAVQLVVLVATLVAAGATGAHLDNPRWAGLAVWLMACAWFLVAHFHLVPSQRWTQAVAAAGLLTGSGMIVPENAGIALGLLTAVALLGYAVEDRSLPLVVIGAAGSLQLLPIAVNQWLPGRLAVPIALLLAGAALVGVAVALARRTATPPSPGPVIDAARYDAVLIDLDQVADDTVDGIHPVPGTPDLIARLRTAGLSVAVVSIDRTCADVLTAAGLADLLLDWVSERDLADAEDPGPASYLLAARRLGVSPLRTVLLSGTSTGLYAGRSAGLGLVIGIDPTRRARPGLADALVRAPAELGVTDDPGPSPGGAGPGRPPASR